MEKEQEGWKEERVPPTSTLTSKPKSPGNVPGLFSVSPERGTNFEAELGQRKGNLSNHKGLDPKINPSPSPAYGRSNVTG